MRLLLLSDPHGDFRAVSALAIEASADVVLLAGDLQMESHDYIDRLSTRELFLRISHSPHREKLAGLARDDRTALGEIVLEHRLLGEWDQLRGGEIQLPVPTYTVWGNHEDPAIVTEADRGEIVVPNLTFLNGREDVILDGWIRVSGIGGNILLPDFLGPDLVTRSNKITATLARYGLIFDRWRRIDRDAELRLFLQHVSPQKDRACANPLLHIAPDLVVSGHMGAPFPQQYTLYAPYRPKDIEAGNRQPSLWLKGIIEQMSDVESLLVQFEEAERLLATDGPDEFEVRYLEEEHPLWPRLSAHDRPFNPSRSRRFQVALNRARDLLLRESRFDLTGDSAHRDRLREYAPLLDPPPPFLNLTDERGRRHGGADSALKRISAINLPDVPKGCVVLESKRKERRIVIESRGCLER